MVQRNSVHGAELGLREMHSLRLPRKTAKDKRWPTMSSCLTVKENIKVFYVGTGFWECICL